MFPDSSSSSAERGENLLLMDNDWELTRKNVGHSIMTSAAFAESGNWRISPEGKTTRAGLVFLVLGESMRLQLQSQAEV